MWYVGNLPETLGLTGVNPQGLPPPARPPSVWNGMPTMDFICLGPSEGAHIPFVVASSPPNYKGFPEMESSRRKMRIDRIGTENIEAARRFLEDVRDFEKAQIADLRLRQHRSSRQAKLVVRTQIVCDGSFERWHWDLRHHVGQAFNGNYGAEQCCYKCQTMFGFNALHAEDRESVNFKTNLLNFDWESYWNPIACAEYMTALICHAW